MTGAFKLSEPRRLVPRWKPCRLSMSTDAQLRAAIDGADLAEIAITSALDVTDGEAPADAFALREVPGVAVVVEKWDSRGLVKCARSWRYTDDVGSDPEFPDVSAGRRSFARTAGAGQL